MSKPKRAIERDYLGALAEAVPLETWREICKKAAEQAKYGHSKHRDFLARYLLGEKPITLLHLAADEHVGHTSQAEIERLSKELSQDRALDDLSMS